MMGASLDELEMSRITIGVGGSAMASVNSLFAFLIGVCCTSMACWMRAMEFITTFDDVNLAFDEVRQVSNDLASGV